MSELSNLFNVSTSSRKSIEDGVEIGTLLHRDDSQLIFFIDPHKESLVVVVEDASSFGPLTVQAASFEESISLLEEEVVLNEFFLILFAHAFKRVEFSCEVTFEGVKGTHDLVHDFKSLCLGKTRSERVISKVSADSDTGGDDHLGILFSEGRGLELGGVHV